MRVKICGITNLEDAMHAIASGADALGFVFYPPSPRAITPECARDIIAQLPPFVETIGLFVHADAQTINTTCQYVRCSRAQLHFEVDEETIDALEVPYLRVVRADTPEKLTLHSDEYRLVDAYCEGYGGSGKRLNLEWFEGIDCSKIILAGGLKADNVAQVLPYGFFGVDVSSGVEITVGKKAPHRVSQFIFHAKQPYIQL